MEISQAVAYDHFGVSLLKGSLLTVATLIVGYVCFGIWFVLASDYSEHVVVGEYHLQNEQEQSTLILRPDHIFSQQVSRGGRTLKADGTWRLFLQSGIAFSESFLSLSGQDRSSDGTAYGNVRKFLGIGPVSIELSQYHVLWYGRQDAGTMNPIAGMYVGDDEHAASTLKMNAGKTFEEAVTRDGKTRRVSGTWVLDGQGDITFSEAFLDVSGQPITSEKTASASNPEGSNLQITISAKCPVGPPIFHKQLFE